MTDEHVDVLVVGAGLSGIGAGYRLQTECPDRSYLILEGREASGGTWDLFRYPGIRSDSDMFTLGYPFRPWTGRKAIADGASILGYLRDTAEEHGIDGHIRYQHRVVAAAWSSEDDMWTVDVEVGAEATPARFHCRFLHLCSGYYRYESGYTPAFPGIEGFAGAVVHPQHWPDDLDVGGQRVVVIGSGATAMTLVPALAQTAGHVTMLQRSPTYVATLPAEDPMANALRRVLPTRLAYRIIRAKNVALTSAFYQVCRRRPQLARRLLQAGVARHLPEGTALDPHFTPRYDPWDQRLCLVPDADLFRALAAGSVSIVTDQIETFTEDGIRLRSGQELPADIVVTATGLQLAALGGIAFTVDGAPVVPGETFVYKGFMLSGLPNLAFAVGYTNASWTLRSDITARSVCRLLNLMRRKGWTRAVAVRGDEVEPSTRPVLDLKAGYIQRSAGLLPQQGSKAPWVVRQNFVLDLLTFKLGNVTEGLELTSISSRHRAAPVPEREPVGVAP